MKKSTRDYTQTKDAYEGQRESAVYRDSSLSPAKKSVESVYDDDNIPDVDLPKTTERKSD